MLTRRRLGGIICFVVVLLLADFQVSLKLGTGATMTLWHHCRQKSCAGDRPSGNAPTPTVSAIGSQHGCCPDVGKVMLFALLLDAAWLLCFVFIVLVVLIP